jgi:predicted ribosome quality control (RQC) complex YloA/Tae2 family protein
MPLLATNEAKDSAFDRIYEFSFGHKKTIREGMVFIIYFEKSKTPLSGA